MTKIYLIYLIIFIFQLSKAFTNEILDKYSYDIGDTIKYKIETILPNKSEFITTSKLIAINKDQEVWEVNNSPSADKRIYHRPSGNWIASYKDGNEIARAIPHNGGLKFPLTNGDKWFEVWTFTAAGGLVTGKSEAEYKVKKDTIKINNKKYNTLKITMKNPKWNSEKDINWKKDIKWIDIKSGKIVKFYFKNIGFKMEYTATLIE